MKIIKLDASRWKCSNDFYDAILPALGAPDWHGRNVNALVESLVWGEINAVEPPYKIEVMSTQNLPDDVAEEVRWTVEGVRAAQKDYQRRRGTDVEVPNQRPVAAEVLRPTEAAVAY